MIAGEVDTLIIAHTDRRARFGYDVRTHLCTTHQCTILVLNQETLSPEQELVQDVMTIIHCFSSRLYGLRNYRKTIKEALARYDPITQHSPEPDS